MVHFHGEAISPTLSFIRLRFRIGTYSVNRRIFPGAGRALSIDAVLVGHSSQHRFLPCALPGHFLTFATALPCSLGLTINKYLSDYTWQTRRIPATRNLS